jgi:hypothetical protein
MTFFDLNDDVKLIISEHLLRDCKISTLFMSKHQDLQKVLFGEIVFDNDFHKIKNIHDDVKDDDFNNSKIYKIYKDINDVLYIGTTCNSFKKCLSMFKKESKIKRNWLNNKMYYDLFKKC